MKSDELIILIILIVLVIFNTLTVFDIFKLYHLQYRGIFWIADILTDVIYATDMLVQMNISYIDDGIYVSNSYPESTFKLQILLVLVFKLNVYNVTVPNKIHRSVYKLVK